jgi:predicted nucleic acid-binding protein
VTVLDAYAVVAYLRGETAAAEVAGLLRGRTVLSTANAAEVIDQLVRVYGREADCIAAATALDRSRPLATSDAALAELVRAEAGEVPGLPDRNGRLP